MLVALSVSSVQSGICPGDQAQLGDRSGTYRPELRRFRCYDENGIGLLPCQRSCQVQPSYHLRRSLDPGSILEPVLLIVLIVHIINYLCPTSAAAPPREGRS